MKKKTRRLLSVMLVSLLAFAVCIPGFNFAAAKKKTASLSKKKISLTVNNKKTLKVNNTTKKAKWSIKSGKSVVKLSSKKKASVVITAKKAYLLSKGYC